MEIDQGIARWHLKTRHLGRHVWPRADGCGISLLRPQAAGLVRRHSHEGGLSAYGTVYLPGVGRIFYLIVSDALPTRDPTWLLVFLWTGRAAIQNAADCPPFRVSRIANRRGRHPQSFPVKEGIQ